MINKIGKLYEEETKMKKFMEPAIELEIFAVEDVITTSGDMPEATENGTAFG